MDNIRNYLKPDKNNKGEFEKDSKERYIVKREDGKEFIRTMHE